jgi:hypothetical protein
MIFPESEKIQSQDLLVDLGVRAIEQLWRRDSRGTLSVLNEIAEIPFEVSRAFFLSYLSPESSRGDHAHKECRQILIPVTGSCAVTFSNGSKFKEVNLHENGPAYMIPKLTWVSLGKFQDNCVISVLADKPYSEEDYIYSLENLKTFR